MRKLIIVVFIAASVALSVGPGASADGCAEDLVVNEARATAVVGADTVSIRLWEDLTCLPAGDGFGGPADQGHLLVTIGDAVVCSLDGIDMGNDPFGFGSSVHIDSSAPCGADITWSGFPGEYLPDASGPGITKTVEATGSVWWPGETGQVGGVVFDSNATFSKRANLG
jgi:hypothetical protein